MVGWALVLTNENVMSELGHADMVPARGEPRTPRAGESHSFESVPRPEAKPATRNAAPEGISAPHKMATRNAREEMIGSGLGEQVSLTGSSQSAWA